MVTKVKIAPPAAPETIAAPDTASTVPPPAAEPVKKAAKPAAKKAAKKPVKKAAKTVKQAKAKTVKTRTAPVKAVKTKAAKAEKKVKAKVKAKKPVKKAAKPAVQPQTAKILSSEVVYQGPLFRVLHDKLIEPSGKENERDVIRHNGSVVILAMDFTHSRKDPWIVIERQYRHAAGQYLWELPAGKLDPGEDALAGAQRSWPRRPATAPRSGSRWSSTTPAPAFSASR